MTSLSRKEIHDLRDKIIADVWDIIHSEYGKKTNLIALGHKLVSSIGEHFKKVMK